MVEINYRIVICGMICLTIIYIGLLVAGRDDTTIGFLIITALALAMGIVLPSPKIDNKSGVLKW